MGVAAVAAGGAHYLADLYLCSVMPTDAELGEWLRQAVVEAGMAVHRLHADSFPMSAWKDDYGASCIGLIVPLRESHITTHTWEKDRIASIDLFTCGSEEKARSAVMHLIGRFNPRERRVERLLRGKYAFQEAWWRGQR